MSEITVIIPVYNTGRYIDRCMNMVMSQSFQDFDVILIDGGSTDDSPEKCFAWSRRDARIAFICKKGLKLGPSRNLGVKMADTEYVTFYDSDDFWHKDYLRLMMEGTEDYRNDVVLCDINNLMEQSDGTFEKKISTLRFPAGRLNLEAERNFINISRTFAWGKLYRKNLFEKYDIWEPAHAYEDVATVPYIMARAKSVYHVPFALYSYVRNNHKNDMNRFLLYAEMEKALHALVEKFKSGHLYERFYTQLRHMFWGQLCFLNRIFCSIFCNVPLRYRESAFNKTKAFVYSEFPELEPLENLKFYAIGNSLISSAISHIVLDDKQIVSCVSEADVVVVDKNPNPEKYSSKRIVTIGVPQNLNNIEQVSWDMADKIFYKLLPRSMD